VFTLRLHCEAPGFPHLPTASTLDVPLPAGMGDAHYLQVRTHHMRSHGSTCSVSYVVNTLWRCYVRLWEQLTRCMHHDAAGIDASPCTSTFHAMHDALLWLL
jgi:hypothetical protein